MKASWYGVHAYTSAPATRRQAVDAEEPEEPPGPERGEEREGAPPQALGHPVRRADLLEEPEPRAGGNQVAELLVGHRPRPHRRVPQVPGAVEEAPRIEVQGLLAVRAHLARGRQEERQVRHEGQPGDLRVGAAGHDGPT